MQVFSKTEANFSWHVFAVQGCTKKKKKENEKSNLWGTCSDGMGIYSKSTGSFSSHCPIISNGHNMINRHSLLFYYIASFFREKVDSSAMKILGLRHRRVYYILDVKQISHLIYSGVSMSLDYLRGYCWWNNPAIWLTTNRKKTKKIIYMTRIHSGIIPILGMTDIYDHIHLMSISSFLDVW